MRLLLLTIDFPPARGGVQSLLAQLATGLSGAGPVTVVTPAMAGDREWDAVQPFRVIRSGARVRGRLALVALQACALVEVLRRRPRVIVCGHVLLGPLCRVIHAVLGIPYVAMTYAYEIRAPRMRRIAGAALRGASRVVTLSEFGRRAVQAHGVAAAAISVFHPGAALSAAADAAIGTEADAARSPETDGRRIVLSVGRLVDAYKGHDMVIRAMPLILARVPAAEYVVVGDGALRAYLQRLAASLGVAGRVRFVGEVDDHALDAWYRACDVFVLAGRDSTISGGAEGYGLVLVEAGLRGKPVVGGRSGGIPDAVVDGETGLLVDPGDLADI
ncbi:MAG TPA: glycosyltransferase family 4 protein, partial [Dongiaceae bacterium]|nr:glycosyltransferase family 4 protein [Dongiaceae bacterium]